MKTELELTQHCLAALAAEGLDAYIEELAGNHVRLRVPAWESEDTDLSLRAIFGFIHAKLGGRPDKALVVKTPISGIIEMYFYDPCRTEAGEMVTEVDILSWGYGKSVDQFDWNDVTQPDDNAWEDGYDSHAEMGHFSQRLGFLSCLLNYEITGLPPVNPLSPQGLVSDLEAGAPVIYCRTCRNGERLLLRLSAEGQLVLNKRSDNSDTPITEHHFDQFGRLLFDGEVILHRTWPR